MVPAPKVDQAVDLDPLGGRTRRGRRAVPSAVAAVAALCGLVGCASPRPHADGVWIRVNLVGYLPSDPKIAILASDAALSGAFTVGDVRGDIGPDQGAFGPFTHHYRLDFSALCGAGRYTVRFGDVESLPFTVADDAYDAARAALRGFVRLQRCGDNPVTGRQCHPQDAVDTETGQRLDLRGGWHDAGDQIKHMITTSYCTAALFLAGEEEEARWGAALVERLCVAPDVLYVQIADDRDHTGLRTWHEDRVDYGFGPAGGRPAWRATGSPQGPMHQNASTGLASLAGRCAAAMALAGELDTAKSLYALAKARPGCTQSVPVRAPYHYAERTYHDDLQWAATELAMATRDPALLAEALRFAALAGADSWMGKGRHGHYEYFPYVNLAHWRLHAVAGESERRRLASYYRDGLEEVRRRANTNPWRHGTPLVWCSTNDVIALATQAVLYERMTGDRSYRTLATEARDWIFGRNPWGVSFVTGVGARAATDVHHPFSRRTTTPPIGGVVDGPVEREIHRRFERYFSLDEDPLARFQSDWAVYHDHLSDFATNEPILDGTVSLILLLEIWQ
jgi:hypothetical protein